MSLTGSWSNVKTFLGLPGKEKEEKEYEGFLPVDENLRFLIYTFIVVILLVALISLVWLIVKRFCYPSPVEQPSNEAMTGVESLLMKQISEKIEGSSFSIDSAKFLNIKSSKNDRPFYLKRIGTDPMLNLQPKTKKTASVWSVPDITEILSRQRFEEHLAVDQSGSCGIELFGHHHEDMLSNNFFFVSISLTVFELCNF